MKNVDKITPAQSRAARGLIYITQAELARRANLGQSTVIDFEKERRIVSDSAIAAIREALESCGVLFLDQNGNGPGVALRLEEDNDPEPSP